MRDESIRLRRDLERRLASKEHILDYMEEAEEDSGEGFEVEKLRVQTETRQLHEQLDALPKPKSVEKSVPPTLGIARDFLGEPTR